MRMMLGLRSAAERPQAEISATAPRSARRSNEFTKDSARTAGRSAILFLSRSILEETQTGVAAGLRACRTSNKLRTGSQRRLPPQGDARDLFTAPRAIRVRMHFVSLR